MNELYGLAICGGKSSRMGTDKSLLVYHGKPQRDYVCDMLAKVCNKVFISCNAKQFEDRGSSYARIVDSEKYENIGPMASLLSAFDKYTDADFLTIGCDYPLVEVKHLNALIKSANNEKLAISYFSSKYQVRQPLLALYKSECRDLLLERFEKKDYSLLSFLNAIGAEIIMPENEDIIKSIDTKEEYEEILKMLDNKR